MLLNLLNLLPTQIKKAIIIIELVKLMQHLTEFEPKMWD